LDTHKGPSIERDKGWIEQENEQIQHGMEQAQQDLQRGRLEKQSAQAEIERLKGLPTKSTWQSNRQCGINAY